MPDTPRGSAATNRRDWLQRLWWRWLWSDRKARDPFTGFLVREYRRLTDGA